jgi:nucleoside-diphosphate-sugar epimerase
MNNNIIILGNGFLGTSIYNYLIKENYNVKIYNRHNLDDLNLYLNKHNNNYLINCSGIGHPSLLDKNPYEYNNEVNYIKDVLKIVNKHKLFLIHYSSAAACGYNYDFEEKIYPLSQNNTLYGSLKCNVENIISINISNNNFVILRLFSVYGIGLKKQLFYDLFQKYHKLDHIFKLNSLLDERNFISINDVLESTVFILNNKINSNIINISHNKPIKISSAIIIGYSILNKIYDKNFEPIIMEGRNDLNNNFSSMHPKMSSLRKIGLNINSSLDENLNFYYLWLKNNYIK